MGVIVELPPGLINQIAAGEVVERPASVLKELLENSLDAGASKISVLIDGAGSGLVRVRDDGSGIARDDLPRAFLRHATSKIRSYEDLVSATPLGFRGEALASVASVSRITIETRTADEKIGSAMVLDPEAPPRIVDWSGPVGTTISVSDLFFNVPVRKKFLKSAQTEQGHMVEALNRLAMGFPECQFALATPSRTILSLPSRSSAFFRLLDLYPSFSEEDFVSVTRESSGQGVTVYLLRPDRVRRDRQYQHLFINRRWIRHPGLFEAMTQGAAGKLSRDVHVGAWVYLALPPEKLDVNVHPTKREVRLLEGDRLFSLVQRVVEEGFSLHGSGDGQNERDKSTFSGEGLREPPSLPFSSGSGRGEGSPQTDQAGPLGGMFSGGGQALSGRPGPRERDAPAGGGGSPFTRIPDVLKGLPQPFHPALPPDEPFSVIGQIGGTFLVLAWGDGLAVADWHTAHERIRYEQYRRQILADGVSRTPLLLPVIYKVPLSMADALDGRLEELTHVGFDLDRTGPDSFRIRSVPTILREEDPVALMNELSRTSENFELPVLRSDRIDHVLMTVSCHESVRKNDILDLPDGERLVRDLLATEHPYTCPHGRPTIIRFGRGDLDKWFGR